MEFKELSVEELSRGFVKDRESGEYICVFCGERFEDGLIYQSRGRMVTAERAVQEHVFDDHGGVFEGLLALDKQISGLSESQKDILSGLYADKENKELGIEMGISQGTVRTHKFKLQKQKREAKILLALMAQLEDEELIAVRRQLQETAPEDDGLRAKVERDFGGNTLHPFFTQFNLK